VPATGCSHPLQAATATRPSAVLGEIRWYSGDGQ
jgi:hypothetical protein